MELVMDASSGRDPVSGKFLHGNRFQTSPGNPVARRMSQLRTVAVKAQTPEDVLAIFTALLNAGKGGDVAASKTYLDFVIGRPIQKLELTGADGEPIGLQTGHLTLLIMQDLLGYPELQTKISLTIQRAAQNVYRTAHDRDDFSGSESDTMDEPSAADDGERGFDP